MTEQDIKIYNAMNARLAEVLCSLTESRCSRLKGEGWALFTPIPQPSAGDAAHIIGALRERVKALGLGFLRLRSLWRKSAGEQAEVFSLVAFRMAEIDALRLAAACGQFSVILKEGADEACPLKILGECTVKAEEELSILSVYEVELPRPSYFRTQPVFIPIFQKKDDV